MSRKFFNRLILAALLATLLSSCDQVNLEKESWVESRLISEEDTPEIDSKTVGIEWTKNAKDTNINQAFAGNENGTRIDDPCVVKVGDVYHLWFTAVQNIFGNDYYTVRYARSTDGFTWSGNNSSNIAFAPTPTSSSDPLEVSDTRGVRVGSVIWDKEENEFKMWYLGRHTDNKWNVFYASSKKPDSGWIRYPNNQHKTGMMPTPILEPGLYYDREIEGVSVLKERYFDGISHYSFYKMWYSGLGDKDLSTLLTNCKFRINFASSNDGVKWTKNDVPVMEDYPGMFDSGGMIKPVVIKDLRDAIDTYKLWYIGMNKPKEPKELKLQPGLAYSPITGEQFGYYKIDIGVVTDVSDDKYAPLPKLAEIGVDSPSIIRDGNVYKMWYIRLKDGSSTLSYIESW